MPFPRKRSPLQLSEQDMLRLESIRKSRTEEKRRTLRAAFLLDSLSGQSDEAIAQRHHVSRSTVVLCIQKFLQFGLDAALGELPRPGKPRQLPNDAITWVQHCACLKPKELGYSYELWTYQLLVAHVRQHCVAAGHPALLRVSRSKLHKILRQGELRPHKIRYYVEKRDPDFEIKMASVLHVYKAAISSLSSRSWTAPIRSTIKFDWSWTTIPRTSPRRRAVTYRPCPSDSF